MSRSLNALAALATILAATGGLVVLAAAKPVADVPVIATLTDMANSTVVQVGSDLGGPYITGIPAGLSSKIRPTKTGSSWMLFTYTQGRGGKFAQTGRGVRFDLSDRDPDVPGFPTPIPPNTVWPAYLYVNCSDTGVDMLTMTANVVDPNHEAVCPGSFRFWQTETNLWYRVAFNPDNTPGVDQLKVTCIESMASPATGCKTWTIGPAGTTLRGTDPNPKNYTRLLQIDDGGIVTDPDGGAYYVSFAMTITR